MYFVVTQKSLWFKHRISHFCIISNRYDELDTQARDPIFIIQELSVVQRDFPIAWMRTESAHLTPVENSQGDDYDVTPTVHLPYTYMHPTRADSCIVSTRVSLFLTAPDSLHYLQHFSRIVFAAFFTNRFHNVRYEKSSICTSVSLL